MCLTMCGFESMRFFCSVLQGGNLDCDLDGNVYSVRRRRTWPTRLR